MPLLSPINHTARGWRSFLRGLGWLRKHPFQIFLLFLPMFFGLGLLMLGWGAFYGYQDRIFEWLMFSKPDSGWGIVLYYIVKVLLYGAVIISGLIFYALIINVIASPLYDYVSIAVEKELLKKPAVELSWWESFKLIREELKKVGFIIGLSLLLLLIPGVNVIAPLVAAFFAGWDLYDFPLARRGWRFRRRLGFVCKHGWSVFGLGLWLLIPGVQIFLLPLAVVGGTILAVEDLQKHEEGLTKKA